MSDTQAHHILPNKLYEDYPFLAEMARHGFWHQNSRDFNLIGLPNKPNDTGLNVHSGPHTQYSLWYSREILAPMAKELVGLTGAQRTAKLAELSRELVGVNNYLKSQFLDYRSEISLHKSDGDGSAFFSTTTLATIETKIEYKLGALGVPLPVWVDRDSVVYSSAYDATSGLSPEARLAQMQAYVRALDAEYDNLSAAARSKLLEAGAYAKDSAGLLLHQMAYGDAKFTPTFVSNFLTGNGPKVLVLGSGASAFSLFSPDMAHAAVSVIDGMDKGSALVDGLSLTLLGYAFVESGVINDLDPMAIARLLGSSNIAGQVVGKLDNIALDIGKEVIASAIATMLGVGLLWKGYEIYQSIDGLKAALAVAAKYGDDQWIKDLNDMVLNIESTLDSWFSPGEGGSKDYTPQADELATLLTTSFGHLDSANGNDAVWTIGAMLRDYILEKYGHLVPNANALPATNLAILLTILAEGAEAEGKTLQQAFEGAMVESGFYADNPALFAMMPTTYCFAPGTLIDMADGTAKPIEAIQAGDQVMSFDAQGVLVPGRVTQVSAKRVTQLLDFHGTRVTPGHVYLCGDGPFSGQYVPLIDILRSDGAVVRRDGALMRAATGDLVGSDRDRTMIWVAIGRKGAEGRLSVQDARQMRLGTRWRMEDGRDIALADLLSVMGASVTPEGLVRMPDGQEVMFHWTLSAALPRPEDYILARSGADLDQIYAADEWEDVAPRLPFGLRMARVQA